MSLPRSLPGRVTLALGALVVLVAAVACDEEGKSAPERCQDPLLPLFDPAHAGAPSDDNRMYPCVTEVGHSVSFIGNAPSPSAGTSSGGKPTGNAGTKATAGNSQGGAAGGEGGAAGG